MKRFFHLRNFFPKSLFWRSFLIVFVPVLAVQIVVAIIFIDRLYNDVTRSKVIDLAREINYVFSDLPDDPDPRAIDGLLERAAPLALQIALVPPSQSVNRFEPFDISGRFAVNAFERALPGFSHVDFDTGSKQVLVFIERKEQLFSITVARGRISAANPHQLLVAMFFTVLLFLSLAVLFLRNQIRPINRLAQSAEDFGKGQKVNFSPSGAKEVRVAGQAFRSMMSRIERQIEQRTAMLSGVSHDLRTPLTRMRLSLSMQEDVDGTKELLSDVSQMEHILETFLDFSRGDSGEKSTKIDVKKFAKSIYRDRKRLQHDVELEFTGKTSGSQTIMGKETALRRAIVNLLSNAKRYASKAKFTVDIGEKWITFVVEDDGPGIPRAEREKAMTPFERLDQARNQNQISGSGLGLSIAHDIANYHGGRLELKHSRKLGGLRATITIPR